MPFDISWEDSYWERRREEYDESEGWTIPVIDVADEEEDEFDWLDELEEDEE